MIAAIDKNLQRGIKLLEAISDEQYSDTSIPPYYSSIGANMRHILDVFACIFNGLNRKCVDFSMLSAFTVVNDIIANNNSIPVLIIANFRVMLTLYAFRLPQLMYNFQRACQKIF